MAPPRRYPPICGVDGCDRPHKAHGLCRGHFQRQLAHGDPGPAELRRYGGGTCSANGCTAPAHSRGLCKRCYDQQRRAGGADRTVSQADMGAGLPVPSPRD